MQAFDILNSVAIPMDETDIDTDQIIPARFMHKPRVDYGRYCFHDRRLDAGGRAVAGFVMNQPAYDGAEIIVGAHNFGCGSSREHAVYTLCDYGIRSIVAPSFGDIFFNNCFKNGLLPIVAPPLFCRHLRRMLHRNPGTLLSIDLARQRLSAPDGSSWRFEIDAFRKECLLHSLDEIDFTLRFSNDIESFEARRLHPSP